MKVKTLLIVAILILSTSMLYGCGSTKTNEASNSTNESEATLDNTNDNTDSNLEDNKVTDESNLNSQSKKTADNKSNSENNKDIAKSTNKNSSNLNNNKNATNSSSTSKSKEAVSKSNVAKKSNESTNDSNLTYKSKLGFSMKFPSSWKDKYVVKEDNNSVSVYFKSKDPKTPPNSGFLFTVMKKNNSIDEHMYDSIGGKKYITVKNTTYFVGGPTDVSLSEKNTDFDKFKSMSKECGKVIDTIVSSN